VAFILVTLAIMGVSIFLIYKLTNHFGFRMKYKSLILCAFMAFLVNIAAISMSPYLTQAHYIRLVLLVIVAAAVVTIYNEYLVRHDKLAAEGDADLSDKDTETDAAEKPASRFTALQAMLSEKVSSLSRLARRSMGPVSRFVSLRAVISEKASFLSKLARKPKEPVPSDADEDWVPATETGQAAAESARPVAEPAKPVTEPVAEAKPDIADVPTEKREETPAPLKEIAAAEQPDAKPSVEKVPAKAEKIPARAKEEPKAVQKEAVQKPVAVSDKPAEPAKPEEPAKPVSAPDTPPAGIDLAEFHSLDDILDYAYEQKSQKHPENAILAYKEALEKYQDDAYAPFIVIDLGNIYKEKAAYEDAIHTYEDALSLPIIANDAATLEKFHENLSYLRTVQHILSKHDSLRTPFQDIPAGYLKEIEAEFQARQKQS